MDIKILIVDSDKSYQDSIYTHLNHKFTYIHVLGDWKTALEYLKDTSPDVLIADVDTGDNAVLNLIKRIKQTNSKMQMIITSTHFEMEHLLEAIHIGVTDFIPKPIDFNLLDEALEKSVSNIELITSNNEPTDQKQENIYDTLKLILHDNKDFEFTNYYKGVPISRKGQILSIKNEVIEVKLDNVQFQALLYEKYIAFESESSQQFFIAKLSFANHKEKTAKLKNLKFMQYSPKRRTEARVSPNDNFKLVVVKNNIPYRVKVEDISVKSIAFDFTEQKERFKTNDELILNIAIYQDNHQHGGKSVLKLNTTIYRVVPKTNLTNVIVIFNLTADDKESLSNYIYQRELEIINEFRAVIKKAISDQKR